MDVMDTAGWISVVSTVVSVGGVMLNMYAKQKLLKNAKNTSEKVLVTGGTGYIGSHVLVELLTQGYDVVVVDNLSNSNKESLNRVKQITGRSVTFYQVDIQDEKALTRVFEAEGSFQLVMHLAGLKAVGESTKVPLGYYQNNIGGTVVLLNVMKAFQCYNLIFSSSATVYGTAPAPFSESTPTGVGISNPYGKTKYMIEEILQDMVASATGDKWKFIILRYFNPIGAHPSGLIGEDPAGIPNNLMPYVAQVCIGRRESLTIHGNDYPTPDGTGVRDYLHVVDLAEGHVAALKKMPDLNESECQVYNLGCGVGYSVLDVVHGMENASGRKIKYNIGPRRTGDIATCFALPEKAERELNWKAKNGMLEMCRDTWNWQKNNPKGY